jgi:GTP-binding protein
LFYDYTKINVKAGDGGNGCSAVRREKFVPFGGPAGGDGGKGGDIILRADSGLRTLVDFRYQTHYKGDRGEHGEGSSMHGRNAKDLLLRVPVGTIVKDSETGKILADLITPGQEYTAAKGGRGGKGNKHFKSRKNTAPTFAENGDMGEESWLILELKLLADVGLVGFPNVGKSTIISQVSAAKPKIADYHFTTLSPNLGLVKLEQGESFVMADIPGLIEGAAEGAGLGHRFLRHTERTKVLIHVVDISGSENRNPVEDFHLINKELAKYSDRLIKRPMVIAANKMDITGAEEKLEEFKKEITGYEIFPVSAATGEGLKELVYHVYRVLQTVPEDIHVEEVPEDQVKVTKVEEEISFYVKKDGNVFYVLGDEIERLYHKTQFSSDEAMLRFINILEKMGVVDELRNKGAKDGDTIVVKDIEFDFLD